MADQSPEEMLKQQKASCIFCRIVSGAVQSKKVFEDEKVLAILDINPSVKGHILVLTKEHYPIMPLIPPEEFEHLFGLAAQLSGAVRSGSIAERSSVFIANGAVAGQQSPHFLFHIMPREKGDPLSMLDPPKKATPQDHVGPLIQQNLGAVMQQHLARAGKSALLAPAPKEVTFLEQPPEPIVQEEPSIPPPDRLPPSSEAKPIDLNVLARIIEENPEVKTLLINNPAKLQKIVDQNPQFKAIFGNLDLTVLGQELRKAYFAQNPERAIVDLAAEAVKTPEQQASAVPSQATPYDANDLKPAREMTMQQIFTFIDDKPQLREMILYEPQKLRRLIPENERLRIFFEGSNIKAIIQAYQEYAKEKEGVTVTVEPDDEQHAAEGTIIKSMGPTRDEEADAWSEVRGQRRIDLDKISRLFQ